MVVVVNFVQVNQCNIVIAQKTRSPAVAGMGRPFCDVDLTVSIGLSEETLKLKFRVNLGRYGRYGRLTVFKTLL